MTAEEEKAVEMEILHIFQQLSQEQKMDILSSLASAFTNLKAPFLERNA